MRALMERDRPHDSGVTLVEMLVSLALFALVGLASFTTLDAIVKSRNRTEGRLEYVGAADRTLLLFERDLAQAPPDTVTGDESAVRFAGAAHLVTWVLIDGTLTRAAAPDLQDAAGPQQALLPDIAELRLRYLDSARQWHPQWPQEGSDARLVAVDLVLVRDSAPGTMRKLVALADAPQ